MRKGYPTKHNNYYWIILRCKILLYLYVSLALLQVHSNVIKILKDNLQNGALDFATTKRGSNRLVTKSDEDDDITLPIHLLLSH
jgi:hypothetical protein